MADPGRLSASKLTTYFGCSLSYYLKYVVHEPIPTNSRLAFGKAIHYMLDRFYKVNYKSAESFSKFWKYYWFQNIQGGFLKGKEKERLKLEEYEFTGKDETGKRIKKTMLIGNHIKFFENPVGESFGYMKAGENILKRFYKRHKEKPKPLEKEKRCYPNIFGHDITAVIDRIDEMDGKYYVTDYKTDKLAPKENSFLLHRHPQFTLYSLVFRELFGEEEEAILYYHLRTGKVLKTHRSQKDYDYLKRLLDIAEKGISNGEFTPFYGFHCNFCDYQVPCDKYSVDHGGPKIISDGKIKPAGEFFGWHNPDEKDYQQWLETAEER